MADGEGDAGLRRLAPGEDSISALPDELIQAILACLPSTAAAARTSAVSRRLRRVWTGVPALSFQVEEQRPLRAYSSTADAVDAALGAYSASATLNRLTIDVVGASPPASRIDPWLRFASLRLAGELRLSMAGVPFKQTTLLMFMQPMIPMVSHMQQLELPACERATRIDLAGINFALNLPAAGAFTALRVLRINVAQLVRGDVGHLVSTQCPRLRELEMCDVATVTAGLSISSASLERLVLRRASLGMKGRIDVAAPRLYYLALDNCGNRSAAATIITTMLAELIWNHAYNPSHHSLEGADRQIYRLVATCGSNNAALFKRFDAVDELCLRLSMPLKEDEYKKFLQDLDELPKTRVLEVKGVSTKRHLEPTMMHLLRKHSRLTNIKVDLFQANSKEIECPPVCSCIPPESWTTDDVVLDSLEAVEISSFTGAPEDIELLKLLFRCKIMIRRLTIHTMSGISLSYEMQKHIWGLARPHCINLEFETRQFWS
ncbi:hypothetical protein SEVIR_2G357500v4 [Setaria viridis]|uniref:F-box domain-containing protein n=1 Tax=Setaria viridis TaxID=4556 RepID=A0A4U6VYU2_SETVI|nr:putative F-box/LRR-repeat protein At5g02930 [Setaria viridis]TKW35211.1 hypothetical protein SEVIR_2G357500v2 [Setaria viridis]